MDRRTVAAVFLTCTFFAYRGAHSQTVVQMASPNEALKAPHQGGRAHTDVRMDPSGNGGTFAVYGDPNQMIQISSLALSGDGSLLAAGATPGTVDLWDVSRHRLLKTYVGSTAAALSHDGSLLATGSIDIVDTKSGKERCHVEWKPDRAENIVDRMHFSPSGNLLAVSANGSDILIYETTSCKQIAKLDHVRDGDFTPDGGAFVAANYQVFTVWQVEGWKLLHTFPAGPDYTTGFAVSPDGKQALIAGPNNAKLVDISDGRVLGKFGKGWISSVGFSSNDVLLVKDKNGLGLWAADGRLLCEYKKLDTGNLALSDGLKILAAGAGHQRDLLLWTADSIPKSCHLKD